MNYLILQREEKRLNAALFTITRSSSELRGAMSFLLDDENSLFEAAAEIKTKILVGSPRIILCISPSLFAHRVVSFPFSDLRKVREVLPTHLQGEIALPIEDLLLDVLPTSDSKHIAIWIRKSDVASAIEIFKNIGIEPHIVTSLHFAFADLPGITPDAAICYENVLACISSGNLRYFRASNFNFDIQQIKNTLSTFELAEGFSAPRLLLMGESVDLLEKAEASTIAMEKLQLPSEYFELFRNEEAFQYFAGHFAVAKSSHACRLPNFRRGELSWSAGNATVRKKLIITGVLTAIVVILLFVSKFFQYRAASNDLASVNKSISSIYRDVFPNRPKAVDEVSEIKGEIKKLSGIENSVNALDVLKKIAEAKGAGGVINALYEAEIEGSAIRIKGDARTSQSVNEFKMLLSQLFVTSELGEIKSRPDGTVTFTMTGALKGGAK